MPYALIQARDCSHLTLALRDEMNPAASCGQDRLRESRRLAGRLENVFINARHTSHRTRCGAP